MKNKFIMLLTALILASSMLSAQDEIRNDPVPNVKPLIIEGYVDAYFSFDFNEPEKFTRPYFVSYNRHNEFNLNLAYVSVKYNKENIRAVFTPGFGTYMNANYAAERITLKNILEANVGFKVFKHKNIWLDAGVIPSPYTNENAISLDQLSYSRSFASEYVPYYLAGARVTFPLSEKVNLYAYVLNGWQEIEDVNSPLSIGTQLEIKPNDKLLLNWNTFIGNEQSEFVPDYRKRYFSDAYVVYNASDKWSFSACGYVGVQAKKDIDDKLEHLVWYQANASAKYAVNTRHSFSGRVEYFDDPNSIMITPIVENVSGFNAFSGTLGYNLNISKQAMFRLEGRYFISSKNVYLRNNEIAKDNLVITAGLTARFN